jgi:hypothetical protein
VTCRPSREIRGQNPDFTTALSALTASPFWFAPNIAIYESNLSQFCDVGNRTGNQYCLSSANLFLPIFGPPGGYGMMQLDPPPSWDDIWNWRTNIADGNNLLQTLAGPQADAGGGQAYPFWIRQVRQWQANNLIRRDNNQPLVPAPDPQQESVCTFTVSRPGDPVLAQTMGLSTPNTGLANTYWFGDAILMKQYAGAPANYISWLTGTTEWKFNKPNSVSSNIVQAFCSCGSPGSGCIQGH